MIQVHILRQHHSGHQGPFKFKFVCTRFLLKDGQLWLCAPQAKQIWKCLAENAVFLCDREACFKWYGSISPCLWHN